MSDAGVAATPSDTTTSPLPVKKARTAGDYLSAMSPDQIAAKNTAEGEADFAATDKANREIAARAAALQPPEYKQLQALPTERLPPEIQPLRQMVNPFFVAALAIATIATKNHLQGAAQAVQGYLTGIKTRNKELQDSARQQWLDQVSLAKDQNDLVVQSNADAFRQYTGNAQALMNQLDINSKLFQDRQTARALAMGNLKAASEINELRARAALTYQDMAMKVKYPSLEQWESRALHDQAADFQKKNHRTWTGDEEAAAVANVKSGGQGLQLSPEAEDLAATNFRKTGKIGSWGMADKATRIRIANKAAQQLVKLGISSDAAVAAQQEFNSDAHALNTITSRLAVGGASEQAALAAMGQAASLMNKGAGTPYGPVVNRWLQAGRQATSDPDVAAFNTAMDTFTMEAAKVMTGSTGSAGSSDAARREAAELAGKYGSPEQISRQFQVLKNDMRYKINSWQQMQRGFIENMGQINAQDQNPQDDSDIQIEEVTPGQQ